MNHLIDTIAQNMHAEAYVLGMVKQSWLNTDSASQDGWRLIAEAAISAMNTATSDSVKGRKKRERV